MRQPPISKLESPSTTRSKMTSACIFQGLDHRRPPTTRSLFRRAPDSPRRIPGALKVERKSYRDRGTSFRSSPPDREHAFRSLILACSPHFRRSSFSTINLFLSPTAHAGIPTAASRKPSGIPAGNSVASRTQDHSQPLPAISRPPVSGSPPPSVPTASTPSAAARCRAKTPDRDNVPSTPAPSKVHKSDSHTATPTVAGKAALNGRGGG